MFVAFHAGLGDASRKPPNDPGVPDELEVLGAERP
jgi:hypothetical protein